MALARAHTPSAARSLCDATRDALFIDAQIPGEAFVDAHVRIKAAEDGELSGGRRLGVLGYRLAYSGKTRDLD